ncbi:MAG: YegP family protein [Candidatus Bathyarchaeota archaeon]|nr:YegP family protein [Candidatus Bathyarchaeota archaeon]
MPEAQFEIYKDTAGEYRFRLRAPNGEIISVSEGYTSKDGCKNGIASVRENAPKAIIQDLTGE